MPSQKPSSLRRLRDLAKEKFSRNSKLTRLHQLEQNETKNLRAEELAMSPPGTTPILMSSTEARELERKRLGKHLEDKPLPSIPCVRRSVDYIVPAASRNDHDQQNINPENEISDSQHNTDPPIGLGISSNKTPTATPTPMEQTEPNPKSPSSTEESIKTRSIRISSVIDLSDGISPSTALLLNPTLHEKLLQTLLTQREVHITTHNLSENSNITSKLQREISRLENELTSLGGKRAGKEKIRNAADQRISDIEAELDRLNVLLADTTVQRDGFVANLEMQSEKLKVLQRDVNGELDRAFTNAKLLEPYDVPEAI